MLYVSFENAVYVSNLNNAFFIILYFSIPKKQT